MKRSSGWQVTGCAVFSLWMVLWTSSNMAATPRHGSDGQVGSNGIREWAAFKILKTMEGKDKLLLAIDLGDHAFTSNSPDELKHKRLRITLGRETFEADTDDRAQIKGGQIQMHLISNGKGMRVTIAKGDFDDLASQIHEDENHLDALLSVFVMGPAAGHDADHAYSRTVRHGTGEEDSDSPTVSITQPEEGEILQEDHVTVKYVLSGSAQDATQASLQLDDQARIENLPVTGEYAFTGLAAGVHVVKAQLQNSDGVDLEDAKASVEVTIVVELNGAHSDGDLIYQRGLGFDLLQNAKRVIGKE